MATPYFHKRVDRVASTQDVARSEMGAVPLLVMAARQTRGRGRSGAEWVNADRALAASLAFRVGDFRPFSLMAGVAAARATEGLRLKWPNDVMRDGLKVGGILVERSDDVVVVGLGLNLWWPSPPPGAGSLHGEDPGPERHAEIGGLWGAEMMEMVDSPGWPLEEYERLCVTVGEEITWEPNGEGHAVGIAPDGGLIVATASEEITLRSGAVSHVRHARHL